MGVINKKEIDKDINSSSKKQAIIISPHTDDEILGCYEILKTANPIIIYTADIPPNRQEEALKLKESFDIKGQFFLKTIPTHFFTKNYTFYFPDPIYETHPLHRSMGVIGEQLGRSGLDVIFYSVNMIAPYIHEVENPNDKRDLLNKVYPSQKDLWRYENKYFLFEGYCKWIF